MVRLTHPFRLTPFPVTHSICQSLIRFKEYEESTRIHLSSEQKAAVMTAALNGICVITGGPFKEAVRGP